jgi:hypothetical protein
VREHRRFLAVRGDIHRVPILAQSLLDEARDLPVIFDDEDFHGQPSLTC